MSSVSDPVPILADCSACLVGETDAQRKTLQKLAERTGFVRITDNVADLGSEVRDKRLAFFFFHFQVKETILAMTLGKIRGSMDNNRRFSPAVLVVGECSRSDVVRFVNLGFDDIVALPEAAKELEKRFATQLNAPISYFETSTYFGPDRRRGLRSPPSKTVERKAGESRHVRYVIQRTPDAGVQVLRRDVVLTSNGAGSIAALSQVASFH